MIKVFMRISLSVLIFFCFFCSSNAQYRRGHTQVKAELSRMLREPAREDYYFALLPEEIKELIFGLYDRFFSIRNPLEHAIEAKDKEKVMFLASISLKVFAKVTHDWGFKYHNIFAARLYISANQHLKTEDLLRSLGEAVCYQRLKAAKLFLDAGANPNKACCPYWPYDSAKTSVLRIAVENSDSECVHMLLAAGADPNKRIDKNSAPPLVLAADKNNYPIVRALLHAQADPNESPGDALYFATRNSSLAMVELLLSHGANARHLSRGQMGIRTSPLGLAVIDGNTQMVKMFLDAGADADCFGQIGCWYTPLECAASKNFYDIAALLLAAKADPNKRVGDSWGLMHYATRHNNLKMVKLLIDHGMEVKLLSLAPPTPLQEAAIHGNVEMVQMLLDAGAPPVVPKYSRIEYGWHDETKIKCPPAQRAEIELLLAKAKQKQ